MKWRPETLLLLLLLAPLVPAEESKEIKFKSRDLQKIKAELSQKEQERERLRKEAEELSQQVKDSEAKIKDVETTLLYTKQKNVEIEMKLASTKNQNDKLLGSVSEQKNHLRQTFKTYYVASMLLSPDSVTPVYSKQIIQSQTENLRKISAQSDETHRNLQSLVETEQVIRTEVDKQQEKLHTFRSGREDKERELTKKKSRQEILEGEMRDLQKNAEELASLIDGLRSKAKEDAAAEKEARHQKQISGTSPISARSLPWPSKGKVVMKFGRQQQTGGSTFVSNGIVIVGDDPQPVMAVADGKVLYAGEFMNYGPMTVVEHPGDWYTVYGHLSHWAVEKGQEIKKGDTVGVSRLRQGGGFEAYFELRFYGKPTDPLPWLERQTP